MWYTMEMDMSNKYNDIRVMFIVNNTHRILCLLWKWHLNKIVESLLPLSIVERKLCIVFEGSQHHKSFALLTYTLLSNNRIILYVTYYNAFGSCQQIKPLLRNGCHNSITYCTWCVLHLHYLEIEKVLSRAK